MIEPSATVIAVQEAVAPVWKEGGAPPIALIDGGEVPLDSPDPEDLSPLLGVTLLAPGRTLADLVEELGPKSEGSQLEISVVRILLTKRSTVLATYVSARTYILLSEEGGNASWHDPFGERAGLALTIEFGEGAGGEHYESLGADLSDGNG